MPKVEVLQATLDLSFKKRVQTLAVEGSALAKSYRDLSERMLNFAEQIGKLSQRAYELDGGEQGQHHRHLRATIAKAIGSDNESALSKWITIGTQAMALLAGARKGEMRRAAMARGTPSSMRRFSCLREESPNLLFQRAMLSYSPGTSATRK
jgi:hypothetical protein